MTAELVRGTRRRLKLSQVQMANLLGVHPLTISKWERGLLAPSPHHYALLQSFHDASAAERDIGEEVARLLVTAGVVAAIFVLLQAALGQD